MVFLGTIGAKLGRFHCISSWYFLLGFSANVWGMQCLLFELFSTKPRAVLLSIFVALWSAVLSGCFANDLRMTRTVRPRL
jgi:hypothetical protein